MKKKIIIFAAAAAVLIALIWAIIIGTQPQKELSSGAKLVFGGVTEMKEPVDTDLVVQQAKCENEIYRESKEDDTVGH